jgi:hypothetical protein
MFVFILCITLKCYSQQSLQIISGQSGKKYEVFVKEKLHYKLKGDLFYKINTISGIRDSLLVFTNDSVIKLNAIKRIKLPSDNHLLNTFQKFFITAGIGFIALNTTNNAINDISPVLDKRAVYISGALLGTGVIMKLLSTRRFKIGKRNVLRVSETNYSNLNQK